MADSHPDAQKELLRLASLQVIRIATRRHTEHLLIVDNVPKDFVADFWRSACRCGNAGGLNSVQFWSGRNEVLMPISFENAPAVWCAMSG